MTLTASTSLRAERLKQWAHWVILGTFGYLLMIPVGHTPVLMVALLLMTVSSVFLVAVGNRTLVRELRVPAILSAAVIVLGVVVGIGNPGWAHSLIAWAAAPVLFWTWAAALTEALIARLLQIALWATIALSAVTLLIAFTIPTRLPEGIVHPVFGGESDGYGFGAAVAIYGTGTLMAATPMWITGALLPTARLLPGRPWMVAAAVAASLATAVSTRRATVVLALVVPVVIIALCWFTRDRSVRVVLGRRTRAALVVGVVLAVAAATTAAFIPVVQRTAQGVVGLLSGQAQGVDERVRQEQIPRLWEEFLASPLWGNGIGMTIDGYVRHEIRPWVFEMQYNMLLAHIGILGAVMLIAAVVLIIIALWKAIKVRPDMRPLFAVVAAGALSILVGHALNPMLQAPGHFWAVFLLIACVNVALRSEEAAAGDEQPAVQSIGSTI